MSSSSRLGLILFGIYLFIYCVFVLMNAFVPEMMEQTPLAGVSLAVLFGFALIVAAFVLSMIYGIFSSNASNSTTQQGDK